MPFVWRTAACAILVLFVFPFPVLSASIGKEFVPPDHWVYRALDRFQSLGFVMLPSDRPYNRDEIIRYVSTIQSAAIADGRTLAPRDRFELDRMVAEFSSADAQASPKARFDPPVYYGSDGPLHLEFDIDAIFRPQEELLNESWEFFIASNPEIRLHVKSLMTWELRYRLEYGPETGDRADEQKPTPRTKSWRGLTALYERSYIIFGWKKALLYAGRDYIDWGPTPAGNLIAAWNSQSLDKIGGRIDFRKLRFSFFHSTLSRSAERYFVGHRLELGLQKFVFGISETVLYVDRAFDPIYLLPISAFYANQFNEADDDNVLWSLDAKWRITGGLLVYGSLLLDDFQFERNMNTPDKIAWDVGLTATTRGRVPATFRFNYRFVDIYTYTHEDSGKQYVAGTGEVAAGWPYLGAQIGPDADVLNASAAFYPWPNVTATLLFAFQRRGEGNDGRTFFLGDDPDPPFPSGVVEKIYTYGLSLLWELPRNSSAGADVFLNEIENQGNLPADGVWKTAARLFMRWDF